MRFAFCCILLQFGGSGLFDGVLKVVGWMLYLWVNGSVLCLQKYGPVSEQLSAAVAREILQVIRMCHENNIVHGDIKTSNFILKSSECNPFHDKSMTVLQSGWLKAIDFGCSQLYQGTVLLVFILSTMALFFRSGNLCRQY